MGLPQHRYPSIIGPELPQRLRGGLLSCYAFRSGLNIYRTFQRGFNVGEIRADELVNFLSPCCVDHRPALVADLAYDQAQGRVCQGFVAGFG